MSYRGSWKIDDYLTFHCNTHDPDTGVATDADSVPTYRIYEDETATPILTGSMALLDAANTTGFYSERIQLTAANGFEKGKCYAIYIPATVDSDMGTTHHNFQIEAEVDANTVSATPDVNVTQVSGDSTAADNLELITEIANIASLTVDASGHLECDVVEIEGADPTDTIRDAIVDDATRIDASTLNTLSGHDPGGTLCLDTTPLTAAETESEANDALVALHLDHVFAVDYNPASKPGVATALLNELIESDGGVSRLTANALEQGPDTTTALTLHSDYDAAKSAAPASEYDTEMARITANVALASVCTETRLAELAAANLPTDIADVPTVAEFNARTQPTADYFDPAADAVAEVTLVTATTTNTDMRGTDSAALASVCTEGRLAELDAANLPTDIANLPGVTDITQRQIPDSIPADGTLPTVEQALYMIVQRLYEAVVVDTTMTVRKVDGSTALLTLTLDDATDPTSITRAT